LRRNQNTNSNKIAIAPMAIANLTKKNRKLIFSGLDKTIAMYAAIQPNCG
jgi:hypothetical protein